MTGIFTGLFNLLSMIIVIWAFNLTGDNLIIIEVFIAITGTFICFSFFSFTKPGKYYHDEKHFPGYEKKMTHMQKDLYEEINGVKNDTHVQ